MDFNCFTISNERAGVGCVCVGGAIKDISSDVTRGVGDSSFSAWRVVGRS